MVNKRAAKATAVNFIKWMIWSIIGCIFGTTIILGVIFGLAYMLGVWLWVFWFIAMLAVVIFTVVRALIDLVKEEYRQNVERFKDE